MDYKFTEIFDIQALTRICEGFTQFSGIVTALLDIEGKVHIATGWQDICTRFHRVHPDTAHRCTESDTILAGQLDKGRTYNVYRCKNGLVDVAIPVMVKGEHVGNFFTGQFFLESPDIEFFKNQAHQFGFDEQKYLSALDKVPVFSEKYVRDVSDFLVTLTELMGEMGVERLHILQTEKNHRDELEKLVSQRTYELNEAKEALESVNAELFKLARIDGLTQAYNRRAFDELIHAEWLRVMRSGSSLSLLMIDIDHFKLFNDLYGHVKGDQCLVSIVEEISKCLNRPADLLARYGGEEFACILPETSINGALLVASFIQDMIKKQALPHGMSPVNPCVTLSIGVASCYPLMDTSANELIAAADECLYQAKHQGRNCVVSKEI